MIFLDSTSAKNVQPSKTKFSYIIFGTGPYVRKFLKEMMMMMILPFFTIFYERLNGFEQKEQKGREMRF